MDLEKLKNHKDSLLSVPRIVGGMCLTDLGIYFIQGGHSIGDDLVALPSIAVGFYMGAKGTMNLFETLGVLEVDNHSSENR